jgi:hypothetical protein
MFPQCSMQSFKVKKIYYMMYLVKYLMDLALSCVLLLYHL